VPVHKRKTRLFVIYLSGGGSLVVRLSFLTVSKLVTVKPYPTEPHLMTFATPSKRRGSVLFKRIVNISLLYGTQGLVTPGFEPRIPSPLAGEGQGEGDIK
jgi:hypothetical protein